MNDIKPVETQVFSVWRHLDGTYNIYDDENGNCILYGAPLRTDPLGTMIGKEIDLYLSVIRGVQQIANGDVSA